MNKFIAVIVLVLALGAIANSQVQQVAQTQQQTFGQYVAGLSAATSLSGSDKLYVLQGGTSKSIVSGNTGFALLNAQDQTMSGGANITPFSNGVKAAASTLTVDCGKSPLQFATNGGAFTVAAPSIDGSCIVLLSNNASAGAISFSGFSEGTNTGDTLDATNGHVFALSVTRINGLSHYLVSAYQ